MRIRSSTFLWFSLFFSACAMVIWIRIATVRETYSFVRQERELRQLQEEIQQLRLDWLQETTPPRLIQLSKEMNLQRPTLNQIVRVKAPRSREGNKG